MKKPTMLSAGIVLSAALLVLWGCPKKTEMSEVQAEPQAVSQAEERPAPVEVKPETASETTQTAEPREEKEHAAADALKPIYFDFDQSTIRDDAKAVIQANAAWLKANPQAKIRIEGNCDERGTKEYNLTLGQRRAASARKYLADLGIGENRINLISFGKEKPVCSQETEECMQKNRRGDFVVTDSMVSASN